jgi:HD-GYP domain-containing protein (c-di-GMP phosphodiesterase class II)
MFQKFSRRYLDLIRIIATSMACLACGLAIHGAYFHWSLRQSAEAAQYADLSAQARRLATAASPPDAVSSTPAPWADVRIRNLLVAERRSDREVLLVNSEGKVVWRAHHDDVGGSGPSLKWIKPGVQWSSGGGPICGPLSIQGIRRLAAAFPLASHAGFVVVTADPDQATLSLAAIHPNIIVASGITLLWTCGLVLGALFLLDSYTKRNKQKTDVDSNVELLKQSQALLRTQETVIFALAKLADSRDPETGDHLERISYYCSALASALQQHPEFRHVVNAQFARLIGISSALHDIGKVGIEDAILRKPGPLNTVERISINQHARVGEQCLRQIERRLGTTNFLQMAREIAASHHERWDGTGYPDGLMGEDIPLAARIVAIADVYDALSSRRVYKEALPHEQCVQMIAEGAGSHFDPRLVDVFLQMEGSFRQISQQYATVSSSLPVEPRDDELDAVSSSWPIVTSQPSV